MSKHILVISQYFFPEQFRINDMCEEWAIRGNEVTVITGIPNYPEGNFYKNYGIFKRRKEIYKGINIIRLPIIPRGNSSIMLILNYISFVISGFFWQLFTKIKVDRVFIFEVSPMTQALPGVWYAKKNKIPCYLYVQDLWPESVEIMTGISNKLIIGSIDRMVDYIYKNCSKIFTTSKSFKRAIIARNIPIEKVKYLPQYAEKTYKPLNKKQLIKMKEEKKNIFNIVFAGNIGNAQGLDILPKTAKILKNKKENQNICFNIIGDGRYKETLINLVKKNDLTDMFNFIPKQPASRVPEFLADNDAAFICLTDNPLFEMTIPAKLQTYLACGMPIIASANGETSEIIKEAKAGVTSPSGDEEKLAEAILMMLRKTEFEIIEYGLNSKKYSDVNFNKEKIMNEINMVFNENEN